MHVHHVGFRIKGFYRLRNSGIVGRYPKDAQHRLTILQTAKQRPVRPSGSAGARSIAGSRRSPRPTGSPRPWPPAPARPAVAVSPCGHRR